ncbi:Uma2 family endonuclease [Synechocystis salina]|nr:Uma2 family endonuclease [Synechocystis salina]
MVELRSKTDSLSTLQEKMGEYIENGARLGWLIDAQNCQVKIYRSTSKTVEILEQPDTLSGEDILPDFLLSLNRIWP